MLLFIFSWVESNNDFTWFMIQLSLLISDLFSSLNTWSSLIRMFFVARPTRILWYPSNSLPWFIFSIPCFFSNLILNLTLYLYVLPCQVSLNTLSNKWNSSHELARTNQQNCQIRYTDTGKCFVSWPNSVNTNSKWIYFIIPLVTKWGQLTLIPCQLFFGN